MDTAAGNAGIRAGQGPQDRQATQQGGGQAATQRPVATVTREHLQKENDQLRAALEDNVDLSKRWMQKHAEAEKKLTEIIDQRDGLKDELYRMTIENARLEGYRDRVREFDPVTEKQEYDDRRQQPRDHDFGGHSIGDVLGFGRSRPAPWYRRG